jgi:hypothetical protein
VNFPGAADEFGKVDEWSAAAAGTNIAQKMVARSLLKDAMQPAYNLNRCAIVNIVYPLIGKSITVFLACMFDEFFGINLRLATFRTVLALQVMAWILSENAVYPAFNGDRFFGIEIVNLLVRISVAMYPPGFVNELFRGITLPICYFLLCTLSTPIT